MSTPQITFENASTHPVHPCFFSLALPWLGMIEAEWNGSRGRCFFDHGYDLRDRAPGEHEVWAGRLHVAVRRDHLVRTSRLGFAALALAVANVAGWTEGHLWRLF